MRLLSLLALLLLSLRLNAADTTGPSDLREPLTAGMDRTVDPRKDFYSFANGTWMKNNQIPSDKSSWGSFNELHEKTVAHLKELVEGLAQKPEAKVKGTIAQQVSDFYASALDTEGIEKAGITPLEKELAEIAAIKTRAELAHKIAQLHLISVDCAFDIDISPDEKQTDQEALHLYQGGLGLPNRDYYLEPRFAKAREGYLEHLEKVFALLKDSPAQTQQEAQNIFNLELALAKVSRSQVDLRDPNANYHKMTLAELARTAPEFPWENYFKDLGVTGISTVIIGQPEFFKAEAQQFQNTRLDTWKNYLRWNLLDATSAYLSSDFETENFNFHGKLLQGTKEMEPRWKRAIRRLDGQLGQPLGQLYVAKYFPPEAKQRVLNMITEIRKTFRQHLEKVPWMAPETRKLAVAKLDAMNVKIGYPDVWRDFSSLDISRGPYVTNALQALRFNTAYELAKLGKPVDRREWSMTPPTINAYYSPDYNDINFPAGILQAPFFDLTDDDAVVYGGIGVVMAHEMTHGFDDEGRNFDAQGKLHNWWTPEDEKRFNERTTKLVNQYSAYQALPGLPVNGKLCLGENIADLGGVTLAFETLERINAGKKPPLLEGYSPEQRFFIAFARIWRTKALPQDVERRVTTDPHSPGQFRAVGPSQNLPAFYQTFQIKPGDPMWLAPELRTEIW